ALINVNDLPGWDKQRNFFENTSQLKRFYTHDGKMKMQIHKHTTRSTGWLIYNKMQIFFKPFQPPTTTTMITSTGTTTTTTTGYNFTHPSDLNTCVSVFIGFSYHDVHGFLPERVDENQQEFEGGWHLRSQEHEDDDEDNYSDETDDEEFYTREKEKEEER